MPSQKNFRHLLNLKVISTVKTKFLARNLKLLIVGFGTNYYTHTPDTKGKSGLLPGGSATILRFINYLLCHFLCFYFCMLIVKCAIPKNFRGAKMPLGGAILSLRSTYANYNWFECYKNTSVAM